MILALYKFVYTIGIRVVGVYFSLYLKLSLIIIFISSSFSLKKKKKKVRTKMYFNKMKDKSSVTKFFTTLLLNDS